MCSSPSARTCGRSPGHGYRAAAIPPRWLRAAACGGCAGGWTDCGRRGGQAFAHLARSKVRAFGTVEVRLRRRQGSERDGERDAEHGVHLHTSARTWPEAWVGGVYERNLRRLTLAGVAARRAGSAALTGDLLWAARGRASAEACGPGSTKLCDT
eukprot:scaffold68717_cov69-Phaeocystis_antarctica.AAC.6